MSLVTIYCYAPYTREFAHACSAIIARFKTCNMVLVLYVMCTKILDVWIAILNSYCYCTCSYSHYRQQTCNVKLLCLRAYILLIVCILLYTHAYLCIFRNYIHARTILASLFILCVETLGISFCQRVTFVWSFFDHLCLLF